MIYILYKRGCLECGEDDEFKGAYEDEAEALAMATKHAEEHPWSDRLTVEPVPVIKSEETQ